MSRSSGPPRRVIACLCAQWCGTCRDYRDTLQAVAPTLPADTMIWIDIEDDAELVDDVDVETFPCMLVLQDGQVRFFGPVLPGADNLQRLLRALDEAERPPATIGDEVSALADRIRLRLTQTDG